MKRKIKYSIISFFLVIFIHIAYSIWNIIEKTAMWKQVNEINPIWLYFTHQDYFLGISYALTGAFTIYALFNFLENRKNKVFGTFGGVTFAGVIYFASCFLTGCCGSPMLTVYLSLFGSSFLGFAKPLTAGLTIISVILGFVLLNRSNKKKSCCINDDCCNIESEQQ